MISKCLMHGKYNRRKDSDEKRVMHSKSENVEIMISDKANEVIEERFLDIKFG